MLDKFSQSAIRVIYWARVEAGRLGSEAIEPEHLLLGVLAEDQGESEPPPVLFFSSETAAELRRILAESASPGVPKPDTEDMPLAERSKSVFFAAEDRAGSAPAGLLHILWGLVSDEENSVSNLLKLNGVTVGQVEEAIRKGSNPRC